MNFAEEVSDANEFRLMKRPRVDDHVSVGKFEGVVPQIWLGTFKSEKEAAMAYESASIKLRNVDVLTMVKDGSYQAKFAGFLKRGGHEPGEGNSRIDHRDQFSCTQLFQKELIPSDVGKLNRPVIPKKFAQSEFCVHKGNFRYCYRRSSQSFVFTRGWNRFVKEKNLKEDDIVSFYTCVQHSTPEIQHLTLIDIKPSTIQKSIFHGCW
ncbi:hypothetical protein K2173_021768 [Erythroxylum novogranatense]|uniref:AP2/ERF domain-containing protein n=1 Tax=Erythroxylum novogranatense TaxID=1862640 RepID=A0AAV8TYT5_9ROSI|nr:hypothetical protein K2173_021768 [Erythroxylum novogranatense]